MRPINLIPEDQRRSHGTTTRTGPLVYLIVGALGVLLLGVVMLVLTSNQISERKGEVATLESERSTATAQAEALASFVNFQDVAESRTETVAELADSRFDWVRVIRQLSLILPPQVYLTDLTASTGGTESTGLVPNLQIAGCAPAQDTVAAFVASLKEIDGVTRVGLSSSSSAGGEEGGDEGSSGSGCQAKGVYIFSITATFDGAPPSVDASGGVVPLGAEAATETESSSEGEESESSSETSSSESTTQASAAGGEPVG